ncbi:hypothetical protein L226DRAFT_571934 [Lentinus tigrinus ALCF2SS1-7]|uniref:uncharacterized protein n=1 Tax=Lentinus tigrinus ALCF2SS1-7 TaxID=1328758 RepID=UPI001166016F|nr:hypothetical protein L226DRAFT_571934 [Lentinus tigrinus ALCF2SS1-7]
MSMDRTNEPGNVEGTSTLPRFTAGELLTMLIRLFDQYELEHNEEITNPCLQCLRWVVSGRGSVHMHVPSDSGSESSSDVWDDLSPGSSFLAEHLPPVITDSPLSSTAQASADGGNRTRPLSTSPMADSLTESAEDMVTEFSSIPTIPASPYTTPEHVPEVLPGPAAHAGVGAAHTYRHTPGSFFGGVPGPITPYIANDSGAAHWYIVTRGRRVGVFDSSTMMTDAVSRVSGGTGSGGFTSRDQALAAFMTAMAEGIVRVVTA